ncbi:hypothetical protein [Psychromonas sp. SP041]|uniref:hypothetical protein n=1 Tax=Psychromonas sp. SP041 TaxID=1365007 RepID=UPI0003F67E75|nr:hypothetical protein [Psychromonas sp. SP041]
MFIFRAFIYLIALAGVAYLIGLEGYDLKTLAHYDENTLTEHMQDILTLSSSLLFLYAARLDDKLKVASTLLAALLAMMFVRESDSLLDQNVYDGAWETLVLCIGIVLAFFLRGKFSTIYSSLKAYSETACYGTFLAGLVVLLAFSRVMGRGTFWTSVMGENYMRIVKNIVEEGTETLGYTLIFISAIELVLICRKRRHTLTNV